MSELLTCPFCGGEAVLHPTYDMDTGAVDGWFAWCDNGTCECKPETGQFFTEAEAIAAWNTRAERTCKAIARQTPTGTTKGYICSDCGKTLAASVGLYPEIPNYCPNCGAKVVGE